MAKEKKIAPEDIAKEVIEKYQKINSQNYLIIYKDLQDRLDYIESVGKRLFVKTAKDYLFYLFKKTNSHSEELYLDHVYILIDKIKSIDLNSSQIITEKYLSYYVDSIATTGELRVKLENIDELLELLKTSTHKYLAVTRTIIAKLTKHIEIKYLHVLASLQQKYAENIKDISKLSYQESIVKFLHKVIEKLSTYDDVSLNSKIFVDRFKTLHSIDKNIFNKSLRKFVEKSSKFDFANFSAYLKVLKEIAYETTDGDVELYHNSIFEAAYYSLKSSWTARKLDQTISALKERISGEEFSDSSYYATWYIKFFKLQSNSYSSQFNLKSEAIQTALQLIKQYDKQEYIHILTKYILHVASNFSNSCSQTILELKAIEEISEEIRLGDNISFNNLSKKIIEECSKCAEHNFLLMAKKLQPFLDHCKIYVPSTYEDFYMKQVKKYISLFLFSIPNKLFCLE